MRIILSLAAVVLAACGSSAPTSVSVTTASFGFTQSKPATVECPQGAGVMAGGVTCFPGDGISVSQATDGGWQGLCIGANGGPPTGRFVVFAVCGELKPTNAPVSTMTISSVNTAPAQCPGNETLIGGGCACSGGDQIISSAPTPDGTGWTCECASATGGAPGMWYAAAQCVDSAMLPFLAPAWGASTCSSSQQQSGGGCTCPGGEQLSSCGPDGGNLRWQGSCVNQGVPGDAAVLQIACLNGK